MTYGGNRDSGKSCNIRHTALFHFYDHAFPLRYKAQKGTKRSGSNAAQKFVGILEKPAVKITDVSGFRIKHMKATDVEILAAVDGKMCVEQAEKSRIIRSHMDVLELCKLNLQSLILATSEKYLPQLNIIATAQGIQAFSAIGVISEIGVDISVLPTSKHLCS